ncbi:hypothetical protein N431DRAFT_329163 [Stipitochalara longipes BDJ]|nr:hypothetical protein N431DRAFT_329163 [Stipitochalara longipes BDJ]
MKAPEGIAIAEICVYIPVFFLTIVIVFRHGFKRQSGWIYLAIFCLIRIIGAIFKILSASHPFSITDLEWASILSSVGLSPLLLASLGLLKRITDLWAGHGRRGAGGLVGKIVAKRVNATSRRSKIIQIAQLPIVIGLILCIVGGTDAVSSNAADASKGPTFTKAGVVIFLVAYILLASLLAITLRDVGEAPSGERRLFWVLVAAIPFLGIRLLWSLIAVFGKDQKFKLVGGDPWINFGMAIVEEFVIVCMYTATGFTLEKS